MKIRNVQEPTHLVENVAPATATAGSRLVRLELRLPGIGLFDDIIVGVVGGFNRAPK